MEFRWLTNILYKGKRFMVLSSKKHQKFFLRILEDNSLLYPTLEEFSELYKIFTVIPSKATILFDKSGINSKKEINNTKTFKFFPKVIFEGALISLASAMILSGCGTSIARETEDDEQLNSAVEMSKIENDIKSSSESYASQSSQTNSDITEDENFESEFQRTKEKIIESNFQFDIQELPEEVLECHSYVDENSQKIIYCENMDEFREYVNVKNPTYNDLRQVLNQNENIPDKYKEILRNGLNNLEEKLPNLDLVVLYYNLNRIKVFDENTVDFEEEMDEKVSGYFKINEGVAIVNSDESDEVVLHEVFGHGITEAYIPDKNVTQSMTPKIVSLEEDENASSVSLSSIGRSLEEGKADTIAAIAAGESPENTVRYITEFEQLRIYMETTNTSLEELTKYGIGNLILKMKQNDVNKPVTYIENIDFIFNKSFNLDVSMEIPDEKFTKNNINAFFIDYFDDKLNAGMEKDEAKKIVQDIMDRSDFLEITAQNGDYIADSVNAQELTEYVVKNIENLKIIDDKIDEQNEDIEFTR